MAPSGILEVMTNLEKARNHARPYHMPGAYLVPTLLRGLPRQWAERVRR
jgi:hypothetical protein